MVTYETATLTESLGGDVNARDVLTRARKIVRLHGEHFAQMGRELYLREDCSMCSAFSIPIDDEHNLTLAHSLILFEKGGELVPEECLLLVEIEKLVSSDSKLERMVRKRVNVMK